jgi:protein TonB
MASLFNNWDNVVAPVRNDMVFEDRNKEYGAYYLRKNHNKNVALALLITGTFFFLLVSAPAIIAWLNKSNEVDTPAIEITQLDLLPPPPIDETVPPPPPPPPPPVMETVKFTPPVVTDEEVVDDPPPVQTDETPQISTVTQEGTDDAIIIPKEKVPEVVAPVVDKPLSYVEQMPAFPGGEEAMNKFINEHIVYPDIEREMGVSGVCYVTFVVEKDGNITGVKVLRAVADGPGYSKAATDVVKKMPKWNPGKQNGRAQRVQFVLPVRFTL